MSVLISCEKCGAENRLGTLFCRECGTRLNLKSVEPGKGHHHMPRGAGRLIGHAIRVVIFLALVVLLGLLCWGTDAPGEAASPNGSKFIVAKMNALRGAVLRKNEVSDVMTETDINAYINSRILNAAGSSGGLKVSLEEVSIDLQQDKVLAWLSTKLGPLPLTYTAEATLSRGAGRRLEFKAGPVSIGRVSMPAFLRGQVLNQFEAVFSQFHDEKVLLDRLTHVQSIDGALEVGTVAK